MVSDLIRTPSACAPQRGMEHVDTESRSDKDRNGCLPPGQQRQQAMQMNIIVPPNLKPARMAPINR